MAKPTASEQRLERLKSNYKWYVGGGRRVLWAPEFPLFLHRPGFWDPGTYLDIKLGPILTYALLEEGKILDWSLRSRSWRPDACTATFDCGRGLIVTETRSVTLDDSFHSRLEFKNSGAARSLDLILWSRVDATDTGNARFGPVDASADAIAGTYEIYNRNSLEHAIRLNWTFVPKKGSPRCDSFAVMNSEPGGESPDWNLTPFYEVFEAAVLTSKTKSGELPNVCQFRGGIEDRQGGKFVRKSVFVALHRRLKLPARGSAVLFGVCRVEPVAEPETNRIVSTTTPANAASTAPVIVGEAKPSRKGGGKAVTAAKGKSSKRTPQVTVAAAIPKPKGESKPAIAAWQSYFDLLPQFSCSDPFIEKYFDYRWYGLRLNAIDHAQPPLKHPCVFEGVNPGWFRHAISYSAQVLPRDLRWMHDPAIARGCILNFLENQRPDGFIPGGLLTGRHERHKHTDGMYHADWAGAVRAIHEIHPDRDFLEACYKPLHEYMNWLDRVRDSDQIGLYDVRNQAETGQEYMSRYLFVDSRADEWGQFRLKGVDATVYAYQLQRGLSWMCREMGVNNDALAWGKRADITAQAVRERMWSDKFQKFCDVDPRTGGQSAIRACTDFYPFMTDIADAAHIGHIRHHLLNAKSFWTAWPAPSTALDDPTADAFGRWLDKRHNCPWNGRTWLMTNSHIAEALANAALTLDPALEPHAVSFITRFIHMLFIDRDINRPTSFEYYNPLTGQAPFFRGVDDYMHSWIIDLIMKYVVGIRTNADGRLIIHPLNFGLKNFELTNCVVGGKAVSVSWNGRELWATVGKKSQKAKGLVPLVFNAPPR